MTDQRDRSIDTLLRRRHLDADAASADQCVDAELLAAWIEGGLSRDANAGIEKHAAGCARCQALLAAMARSTPAGEVQPWWRSLTATWLVPVAAMATALILWISVAREPATPEPPQASSTSAAVPAPPLPDPELPRSTSPGASADAASAPASRTAPAGSRARQALDKELERRPEDSRLGAVAQSKPSQVPQLPVSGLAGGAIDALGPQGQTTADSSARSAAPVQERRTEAIVTNSRAPAAAASPPANAASAEAKTAPVGAVAESVSVSRELAANQSVATRGGAATFIAGTEIQSPDPNYRWRILPPAAIQRSTDGGTTWAIVGPQRAPTRADGEAAPALTAGSSPSRDVCWIVGRAGSVLLSADGTTWQRRPFPENVDLKGVRASDARNATVITIDGRQFATADGGATWVLTK